LEGLFDRNHDHRRRLLAVNSKTPLQDRIDTDPGPTAKIGANRHLISVESGR
jgi:hypothetical protein